MKRFMQLTVVAASLALGAGVVAAEGGIRPDDRANHGVGAIGFDGSTAATVRPDDRATHGPGSTALGVATLAVRPDDRATHGPGSVAAERPTRALRPDDRAWRGVGPPPAIEVVETQAVRGDGFDWADAGIGALAAFGLGLLLVGGSVVMLRRQRTASFS